MRGRTWVLSGAVLLAAALVVVQALGGSGATSLAERQADDDSHVVGRIDRSGPPAAVPSDGASDTVTAGATGGGDGVETPEPQQASVPPPNVAEDFAVLHDGPWTVEEGVWSLGPEGAFPVPDAPGLLGVDRRERAVTFFGPALYGRYDLRVERHPTEPPAPSWCGDVVEVSLPHGDAGLRMGSFESSTDTWAVPRGDLRVRWCAEDLDVVARETADDELDGDDYRLYSGRQLVQLWAAPLAAPSSARLGSRFAQEAERS